MLALTSSMKRLWVITTLSVIAWSCKPADGNSTLKAVDQFAGSTTRYSCKGKHQGNDVYLPYIRGITSEAKKSAILDALSAVPTELKDRILRGPIKSFVELTSSIESVCKESSIIKANSKNKSTVFACPKIVNGEAIIYVDQKPENIRAGLVRGLAYYVIAIDSQIDISASSDSQVVIGFVPDSDVKTATRHQAALVFLDEVYTRQKTLSIFETILPRDVTNAKTKADRDAAFFNPSKTNVDDRDAFSSYFIAEVMDSMMCSTESRSAFAASFPNTFALFSKEGLPSEESNASEGFSLAAKATTTMPSPSNVSMTRSEVSQAVTRISQQPSSSSSRSSFPVQGAMSTGRTILDEDTGKRYAMYQKGNDWFYQKDDGRIRQTPVHTEIGTMYDVNSFAAPKRMSLGSFASPTSVRTPVSSVPSNARATFGNLALSNATQMAYRTAGNAVGGPLGGFVAQNVGPSLTRYAAPAFGRWLSSGSQQSSTPNFFSRFLSFFGQ
jgi:hypothetical protein